MTTVPSSATRLSVSIVVYHSSLELLGMTIDSLLDASRRARVDNCLTAVELMVVDNSQCADYAAAVKKLIDSIKAPDFFCLKYLVSGQNPGFGGGHNQALSTLDSAWHLILNPDVELSETALSTALSALADDRELILVSPKALGSSGDPEFLCKSYPSVLALTLRAFAPSYIRARFASLLSRYERRELCSGDQSGPILLASGCFMMVRSEALRELGGFDERYFLYFEDFDLSLRLGRLGRLEFHPTVQIIHHGGYAASKGARHIWLFLKSGFRFFNDHGWKWI